MNKNLEQTKKSNKQSGEIVNSSTSGATLQASSESAPKGLTKVLSNEQAIAAKGTSNADVSSKSYTDYSTLEETEKFNAKTDAIRDITDNLK